MSTYKAYFNPDPKRPWERVGFWIAFVLALLFIVAMASCGSVNKNKNSYAGKTDSSGISKSERIATSEEDSASKKSNDQKTEEKKAVEEESGVKAVFGPHDPKNVTGPVNIRPDSSGGYSIDPGGRPLESVVLPKSKKTTESKTTEKKKTDSTGVNKKTAVDEADSSATNLKKQETGKSVVKNREPFNWGGLIIPSVIVAFIVLIWLGKKKFRRVDNG